MWELIQEEKMLVKKRVEIFPIKFYHYSESESLYSCLAIILEWYIYGIIVCIRYKAVHKCKNANLSGDCFLDFWDV